MRLGLVDEARKECVLLSRPADYKGGFWVTYTVNNTRVVWESMSKDGTRLVSSDSHRGRVDVTLEHTPAAHPGPVFRQEVTAWSYDRPVLLARSRLTNISRDTVRDVKTYFLMDLDLGGYESCRDDTATFDTVSAMVHLSDECPVHVLMASRPRASRWDVGSAIRLAVDRDRPDLGNNSQYGPGDVAAALQWDHGDLGPGTTTMVDVAVTAARTYSGALSAVAEAWELSSRELR